MIPRVLACAVKREDGGDELPFLTMIRQDNHWREESEHLTAQSAVKRAMDLAAGAVAPGEMIPHQFIWGSWLP